MYHIYDDTCFFNVLFFEKYIFIRFFNFIFFGLNEDKVHFSVIQLKNFFWFFWLVGALSMQKKLIRHFLTYHLLHNIYYAK